MEKFIKNFKIPTKLLIDGHADFGILFMRVCISLLMIRHGLDKMLNFVEKSSDFLDPFGIGSEMSLILAIFAEVFCSLMLCVGLLTRLVLPPLIVTMLIAIFIAHGQDPFSVKEMAIIYLAIFISLLITGPGKLALDNLFFNRAKFN